MRLGVVRCNPRFFMRFLTLIFFILFLMLFLNACVTPRAPITSFGNYDARPPTAIFRFDCAGTQYTVKGLGVCEVKFPQMPKIWVKAMPTAGTIFYSNGQLKAADDFNWYPESGFFLWKKKELKDTWVELDISELNGLFRGDNPLVIDVVGKFENVGVISNKGVIYYRVCSRPENNCSELEIKFPCANELVQTNAQFPIAKCARMAGTSQYFDIKVEGERPKAHIASARLGIAQSFEIKPQDVLAGYYRVSIPNVPKGPTLIDLALTWWDNGQLKQKRTSVLIHGSDPAWSPLDYPHLYVKKNKATWVKPFMADFMEINTNNTGEIEYTAKDPITHKGPGCAFAWSRENGDLTAKCVNQEMQEVPLYGGF